MKRKPSKECWSARTDRMPIKFAQINIGNNFTESTRLVQFSHQNSIEVLGKSHTRTTIGNSPVLLAQPADTWSWSVIRAESDQIFERQFEDIRLWYDQILSDWPELVHHTAWPYNVIFTIMIHASDKIINRMHKLEPFQCHSITLSVNIRYRVKHIDMYKSLPFQCRTTSPKPIQSAFNVIVFSHWIQVLSLYQTAFSHRNSNSKRDDQKKNSIVSLILAILVAISDNAFIGGPISSRSPVWRQNDAVRRESLKSYYLPSLFLIN